MYPEQFTDAQIELQRIEDYKAIYAATNGPEPTPPTDLEEFYRENYSYSKYMGASAVGFKLASWGSIGYSAIRTAGVFAQIVSIELTQNNWNPFVVSTFVFISAICILGAVEGFLYAYGQEKGRESGKLSVSMWGVIAALMMSGFAGLLPSLDLLPESQAATTVINFVRWVLAFVSGLGVIPLVVYGAENLGVLDNKWNDFLNQQKDEIDARNRRKIEAFETRLSAWNKGLQEDYRKIGRTALFGEETFTAKRHKASKSKDEKKQDDNNYTEELRSYLKQQGYSPYDVGLGGKIQAVQIADALGWEVGSAHRKNASTLIGRLKLEYDKGNW